MFAIIFPLVDGARICARAQAIMEWATVVLKNNVDNMVIYTKDYK